MAALGRGDLDAAHAFVNIVPVRVNSRDELGEMAESFNLLQDKVVEAAHGLDEARKNMHVARTEPMARHEEMRIWRITIRSLVWRTGPRLQRIWPKYWNRRKHRIAASPCSASTSTISKRPTTFLGTPPATISCARSHGVFKLLRQKPLSPAWAATNSRLSWPRMTSPRGPSTWPTACSNPRWVNSISADSTFQSV